MNIEDVRKMVSADLIIDQSDLHTESIKTPQLHNKYLIFHEDAKLELDKFNFILKSLRKNKWLYYMGKMGDDDLKLNGWKPFEYSILKTDLPVFMEADLDMQKMYAKIALQQSLVNYLEDVVKIINSRQWNIKSAIEWIKFTQGI
jgi:hypothetical protein|tara:strand:- start:74 stop:508 length:435 start_codon:yes stop_codon:yes gene_type:complete